MKRKTGARGLTKSKWDIPDSKGESGDSIKNIRRTGNSEQTSQLQERFMWKCVWWGEALELSGDHIVGLEMPD